MSAGWNLDDVNFTEFPIIQIRFTSIAEIPGDDFSLSQLQKTIPIRLFILAHRIAYFEIPSIFVESTPSYLISKQDQSQSNLSDNIPSIIVFDLEHKFDDFITKGDFPLWAETKKFIWSLQNPGQDKDVFFDLSEQFFDDLQQAIILRTYYQFYLFSPLYFTTYLLIPPQTEINDLYHKNKAVNPFKFNSIFEPVIIKSIPSFAFNCIKIRWIVESDLNCIVNPRYGPKVGSFILVPPFRHPLCINSITTEKTKIFKNSPNSFNETKNPAFSNAPIIPKINSKVIPLPITKGTISRSISPAFTNSINYTIETTIIISATTIDKERTITFKIVNNNESTTMSTDFVFLTKPSIALYHFFYVKNFQYEYRKTRSQLPYQTKHPIPNNPQSQVQSQNQQQTPQYCHFDDLDIFDIDDKEIDKFFSQHFSDEATGQTGSVSDQQEIAFSFIEDTMPSPYQLITEQVSDKEIKKRISKTINSILLRYNPEITLSDSFINPDSDSNPISLYMKRIDLEFPKINYTNSKCISYFTFLNFPEFMGYSSSISPPIGQMFNYKEVPTFLHLGVPNILLSQDGTTKEFQADNFLPTWEREKLMPISGPKNGHFVVFYETFSSTTSSSSGISSTSSMINFSLDSFGFGSNFTSDPNLMFSQAMNEETVSSFMCRFSQHYANLCFGEMKPYANCDPYISVKLQPLTKVSTFSSSSKTPMNNDTVTTKVEIDIDSGSYECDSMKRSVASFLSSNPLLQFQDSSVVAFIIGNPSCHFFTLESERKSKGSDVFKEPESFPHLHIVYVTPEMVIAAKDDQIRSLCFDVYGMLRKNQKEPIGNFDFMHKLIKTKAIQKKMTQSIQLQIQQVQSSQNSMQNQGQEMQIKQMKNQLKHLLFSNFFFKLFFGFRYQPPFVLRKNQGTDSIYLMEANSAGINMNIAWDRHSGVSVWTTDTGDLLHTAEINDFTDIMYMINNVCSYSLRQQQQQQKMPMVKKITLTLLEEYLGQSNFEKFMQILPPDIDLFTFYHAPSVKARFTEKFNDDVVIFENQEILNGIKMIQVSMPKPVQEQTQIISSSGSSSSINLIPDLPAKPESSCYVLSPNHPAYKMSIYKGGGQERLLQFVKTMSHLSWLSVKPGHENRYTSYPPHIHALIQQNKTSCSSISQIEFLPTK